MDEYNDKNDTQNAINNMLNGGMSGVAPSSSDNTQINIANQLKDIDSDIPIGNDDDTADSSSATSSSANSDDETISASSDPASSNSASDDTESSSSVGSVSMTSTGADLTHAMGGHTMSEKAKSEMFSAFVNNYNMTETEDPNQSLIADKASEAIGKYQKATGASKEAVKDMADFCNSLRLIIVNFQGEYCYDMRRLSAQAKALYDNEDAMENGGKPDQVARLKAWIESGAPSQMMKFFKEISAVVRDPRFQTELAQANADVSGDKNSKKKADKELKAGKPVQTERSNAISRFEAMARKGTQLEAESEKSAKANSASEDDDNSTDSASGDDTDIDDDSNSDDDE